jgi:hypothetical protein
MKATTREQIDYLKKRISKGDQNKKLQRKFSERWPQPSQRTFERRLSAARAEIGGTGPGSFVLLNFQHDGDSAKKQAAENRQNQDTISRQDTTGAPVEKQQADSRHNKQETSRQKLQSTDGEALCMTVLTNEECLLMLSRFALGQYVRVREVVCRGEVIEVAESPNFSQRRAAVLAIMKYHAAVKAAAPAGRVSATIPMQLQEILNVKSMSPERIEELDRQFLALVKQEQYP